MTDLCMVTDEYGDDLHEVIATKKQKYQGKWSTTMKADFCCSLSRDSPEHLYKRLAKKSNK